MTIMLTLIISIEHNQHQYQYSIMGYITIKTISIYLISSCFICKLLLLYRVLLEGKGAFDHISSSDGMTHHYVEVI